jgi:hypothetical protein
MELTTKRLSQLRNRWAIGFVISLSLFISTTHLFLKSSPKTTDHPAPVTSQSTNGPNGDLKSGLGPNNDLSTLQAPAESKECEKLRRYFSGNLPAQDVLDPATCTAFFSGMSRDQLGALSQSDPHPVRRGRIGGGSVFPTDPHAEVTFEYLVKNRLGWTLPWSVLKARTYLIARHCFDSLGSLDEACVQEIWGLLDEVASGIPAVSASDSATTSIRLESENPPSRSVNMTMHGQLPGNSTENGAPASLMVAIMAGFTSLVTAIGTGVTTFFAWQKTGQERTRATYELEKMAMENEELRRKLNNNGRPTQDDAV